MSKLLTEQELKTDLERYYRVAYMDGVDGSKSMDTWVSGLTKFVQSQQLAPAERTWWVTNHDAPEDSKWVAGPFTTDSDAAVCREHLERRESHRNYWLEQRERNK